MDVFELELEIGGEGRNRASLVVSCWAIHINYMKSSKLCPCLPAPMQFPIACAFCLQDGATPLFIASQEGHLEVVERLIAARANVNTGIKVQPLQISSFFTCCFLQNLFTVEFFSLHSAHRCWFLWFVHILSHQTLDSLLLLSPRLSAGRNHPTLDRVPWAPCGGGEIARYCWGQRQCGVYGATHMNTLPHMC